jgi:hypothetical protein
MNIQQIGKAVDRMIREEELPVRADLKPIRQFDGLLPDDPDEHEAYLDTIAWVFKKEHLLLELIPKTEYESDFWGVELDEFGNDTSAFNTADFLRTHKFSLYHWQLEKLCDKIKHMAIDFSIVKEEPARMNIRERAFEFIKTKGHLHKDTLFQVWMNYAYWE